MTSFTISPKTKGERQSSTPYGWCCGLASIGRCSLRAKVCTSIEHLSCRAAIDLEQRSSLFSSTDNFISLRKLGIYWTYVPPQASSVLSCSICTSRTSTASTRAACGTSPLLPVAGGWLQVAQKTMPMSSLIIGIDLAPIKAIRGVHTIIGDITTQKARQVSFSPILS